MKLKTLLKLIQLEKLMATVEQNAALIAEIAESVRANTNVIEGIKHNTGKIFDEVEKLVAAANVEIPGLAELRQATVDQAALLADAVAANTAVDGLIADEVVTPAPIVEPAVPVEPVVETPVEVAPVAVDAPTDVAVDTGLTA